MKSLLYEESILPYYTIYRHHRHSFGSGGVSFTADRPGASTGPTTVARGVVQLEQGIQYDGDCGYGVFTFSNTLLRYGLFERMELRIGGDAIAQIGQ